MADLEVPVSRRLLSATPLLLNHGPLQFFAGDTLRSPGAIKAEPDGPEFRVLFDAVHTWYVRRYGATAVRGYGNPRLVDAVVIRGAPNLIEAPLTCRKVADPGETAWIYFEDAVHPTEQPLDWVRNPPAPDSLAPQELEALFTSVRKTVGVLRHLTFPQSGHEEDDREARKLIPAAIAYMGSTAKRMVEGAVAERGPAWSDLQMAAEAVLKAVIRDRSGTQHFDHDLTRLLRTATTFGVDFDDDRLRDWPKFLGRVPLAIRPDQSARLRAAVRGLSDGYGPITSLCGRPARRRQTRNRPAHPLRALGVSHTGLHSRRRRR